MWGLRAPAEISADGEAVHIDLGDDADRDLVEGFAAAAAAMLPMDLQRRLWSGRFGEVVGGRALGEGATVGDLDAFTRLLGFRADAEGRFKQLDPQRKRQCEEYARGVNAWIDGDSWSRDPRWASLGTRPRLWGAADCVLLARAPHTVDRVGPMFHVEPEVLCSDDARRTLRTLWGALHDDAFRAPDSMGGGALVTPRAPAGIPSTAALSEALPSTATLVALTADRARRLRSRAQDIDLGQPVPRRLTVRRGPEGAVVSDLFGGTEAGEYLWRWGDGPTPESGATRRERLPPEHPWRLADLHPQAVPLTRLVPLEGGA